MLLLLRNMRVVISASVRRRLLAGDGADESWLPDDAPVALAVARRRAAAGDRDSGVALLEHGLALSPRSAARARAGKPGPCQRAQRRFS